MSAHRQKIAIIGGGWAGMAAAVTLVQAGRHAVSVFEGARHWGGRARGLDITGPQGQIWRVDNGQHILIGAYRDSLALMRQVGVDVEHALLRQPLDLRDAQGQGIHLPDAAPPWDALWGIVRATGWRWHEKTALLRRALRWQVAGFRCAPETTVAQLCHGLPPRLLNGFITPLCVSALNLPVEQASGSVFLRILADSLFAGRGGSHFLLPRVDMGALFPEAAAHWLAGRGAALHLGRRVPAIAPGARGWQVDGEDFSAVLIATGSAAAARLVQAACPAWAGNAQKLAHTAIATVYAWADGLRLVRPMLALADGPAQFVFDKGQLGGPRGLLALIVSDSPCQREQLQGQVLQQARAQLGRPDLAALQTVIEKRATFACTPQVQRPAMAIAPGLWACGDYIAGPYPATLEGAVRSGMAAAQAALTYGFPDTTG